MSQVPIATSVNAGGLATQPVQASYGAVPTLDLQEDHSMFSAVKFSALKKYTAEGEIQFRYLGMIVSLSLAVTSAISLSVELIQLAVIAVMMNAIVSILALICLVYEYKPALLPVSITEAIATHMRVFHRPLGRATISCFLAMIVYMQGSDLQKIIGMISLLIAGYVLYFMYIAEKALVGMKAQIADDHSMRSAFSKCAKTVGEEMVLDSKQLVKVCFALGSTLSFEELEIALMMLDRKNSGVVKFEDFKTWYTSKHDDFSSSKA